MPERWKDVPFANSLFLNLDEDAVTRSLSAVENVFVNEAGGHTRFPGLKPFLTIPGDTGRMYLHEWRGDLIACSSSGRLYRINVAAPSAEDVTGVPVGGTGRAIFTATEDRLALARGGPLVYFDGTPTQLLSPDAPQSFYCQYLDGYLLAAERDSQRWYHCEPGEYTNWIPSSVFSADSSPDDILALLVTPYREILAFGTDTIEQFERMSAQSTVPFYRRWSLGDGLAERYGLVIADNAVFAMNSNREIVRVSGQASRPVSADIQRYLASLDDISELWFGGFPNQALDLNGQNFIIIQAPNATNQYGSKGVTLLYDYRRRRFSMLYGWDDTLSRPARWPGWSHWRIGQTTYVGGEGKIFTLDAATATNDGKTQHVLGRTGKISESGEVRIDGLRLRVKRGVGTYEAAPKIAVRVNRDNRGWSPRVFRSLGLAGEPHQFVVLAGCGCAHSWQFEYSCTDACLFEMVRFEVQTTEIGR